MMDSLNKNPIADAAAEAPAKLTQQTERTRRIIVAALAVLLTVLSFAGAAASVFLFNSGAPLSKLSDLTEVRAFSSDLVSEVYNHKSNIVADVYSIPKIYVLPWSEDPAPAPAAENYSYAFGSEKPTGYEDETIKVEYWAEYRYHSVIHLARITIAHPTQLRTAFADGKYGTETRYDPRTIARNVNAVIATNADFYNYRKNGIIVRQNTLYRNKPQGWDILMIDNEGDFHIFNDRDAGVQELLDSGTIVNTLHFGPSLVIDGKKKIINEYSGCGPYWGEMPSPRTAIGQVGRLTYIMCCVEGRMDDSIGTSVEQMAQIMLDAGCTQAYLLDGGQSTTMVIGGESINRPLWDGMRAVSDIVYFASALDEAA